MANKRREIVRLRYKRIMKSGRETWTSISIDESIARLAEVLHGHLWQEYLVELANAPHRSGEIGKSISRYVSGKIADEAATRLKATRNDPARPHGISD